MREAPVRIRVTELVTEAEFVERVVASGVISEANLRQAVALANQRTKTALGLSDPPLQLLGGSLRVKDVIGLLRLGPRVELEVVPKYLGRDSEEWQRDFFFIANLSRFGRVLSAERLASFLRQERGLANLLGQAVVNLYWESARRPLRTYRTQLVSSFDLTGDADPEDVALPLPDGYPQRITSFTRENQYNQVIENAAKGLLAEVDTPETRRQLVRVVEQLSPQVQSARRRSLRVPSRHARWQPLYELSGAILDGFSVDLSYSPEKRYFEMAPGFVLRSDDSWEQLITRSVHAGLPNAKVTGHKRYVLGTRNGKAFLTDPDVSIEWPDTRELLVDAKYIGRADERSMAISAPDVYEGFAFLRASGFQKIALLYPRRYRTGVAPLTVGATVLFEHVRVEDLDIYGYEVEVGGISRPGGFRQFSNGVGGALASLATAA